MGKGRWKKKEAVAPGYKLQVTSYNLQLTTYNFPKVGRSVGWSIGRRRAAPPPPLPLCSRDASIPRVLSIALQWTVVSSCVDGLLSRLRIDVTIIQSNNL